MPEYRYWGTTEIGDTVAGRLSAASPDAAAHLLTLRGLTVQRLEEAAAAGSPRSEPQAETASLADEDFTGLTSTMETATEASLPLTASLRTLAEESASPRFRRTVMRMIAALDEGQPLDQVLRQMPSAFPRRLSVLVDAGVKTGRLPFLMHHALENLRRTRKLRSRVWRSLAYPLVVSLIAAAIMGGILLGLVPTFKDIFQSFGMELPLVTVAILFVSDLCLNAVAEIAAVAKWLADSPVAVVIVACLIILAVLYQSDRLRQWSGVRRVVHRVLHAIPVIGPVFQTAALSSFFRMLATLVETGLALPEALRLAAAVSDDPVLTRGADRISAAIEQGHSPLDAVRRSEALPREMLPVFRWADNRPLFLEGLRGAAETYASRSQLHTGVMVVVLQPMVLFWIGATVGLVVIALFVPLIKLLNDLA